MQRQSREWTRRGLLYGVGGGFLIGQQLVQAAAAQQPVPKQKAENAPFPPERRLGWAVVGLGKFALNQILPSFAECKRSKLVALVSGTPDKARQVASQYGVEPGNIYDYQNFDAIQSNPAIDVVYVIVPNALHPEFTVRAARAGKHVMCEKPMAPTPAECERMIAECRRANRKLMIAYRAQYDPFNRTAIEMVRKGELGKLKLIVADHGRILDPADPADRWRMDKKLAGGGSLVDIGIYSLNATRYLTGEEPVAVSAMVYSPVGDPRFQQVEETVSFLLRFPSGTQATCTSSYGCAEVKRYRVFGDKAFLDLDPATDYERHRLVVGDKQGEQEKQIPNQNQFALEIDHLSECIAEEREPHTPGAEGLRDVRIMQAIYEAAASGQTIRL
ncbi:Gfo/Idh/MocA family protein [Gloeobacter kilaueensis]|uniref:Myo-inositol 2-dehydrogenase n=1 Tax=Gloeobacter kilaueensis (strain ATCC BAA-2537 / CCAP 1431/1 / ULC 316 / JS1) TaxID=1183438 RepID=U5QFA2_GLOK1|nr:Gfo/Idh/MocA family oxidoreductase [Gloeobacter kilaueensis]AGY57558.1 myo-inositol 2-dehydrogenase [Gloeobacter kilaueensis JS1]